MTEDTVIHRNICAVRLVKHGSDLPHEAFGGLIVGYLESRRTVGRVAVYQCMHCGALYPEAW